MKATKNRKLRRRTLKFVNTPYVIDRSSVIKILNDINLNDDNRTVINFRNVEFISRAASHELLRLIKDKYVTLLYSKHLLVSERNKILTTNKINNSFHLIDKKNKESYRNSLSEIQYY